MATKTAHVTHTPGPWHVEFPTQPDAMSEIFAPSPDDQPWRVAYVMRDSNKHQQPIDDANAHLLAAAPDLLAVLKRILASGTSVRDNRDSAEAAIAKAEGR